MTSLRHLQLVLLLFLSVWSVTRSAPALKTDPHNTCYISQSGCKYKVMLKAVGGDCAVGMAGDDPSAGASVSYNSLRSGVGGGSHSVVASDPLDVSGELDLVVSMRKIENLEQTLVRMMEGLSQRSLRHIRQIKTDLRHVSDTMNQMKAKSNSAAAVSSAGGGGGGGSTSGGGVSSSSRKSSGSVAGALVCPTEFVGGGTWPSCYRFSLFNASWHEAREYCLAFGANLVSLDSVKEAYIIDYLLKSTPEYEEPKGWWTSGNYIVRSQKWMWTSRQHLRPIGFSRWAPGEPNARSTMHCLLLYKPDKYLWHDGTCTDKHAFVCEIEL